MRTVVLVCTLLAATAPWALAQQGDALQRARNSIAEGEQRRNEILSQVCVGWGRFDNATQSFVPCNTANSEDACSAAVLDPSVGNACVWAAANSCCTGTPAVCEAIPDNNPLECLMLNGCVYGTDGKCTGTSDSCPFQPVVPPFATPAPFKMTAMKSCVGAGCQWVCT